MIPPNLTEASNLTCKFLLVNSEQSTKQQKKNLSNDLTSTSNIFFVITLCCIYFII